MALLISKSLKLILCYLTIRDPEAPLDAWYANTSVGSGVDNVVLVLSKGPGKQMDDSNNVAYFNAYIKSIES